MVSIVLVEQDDVVFGGVVELVYFVVVVVVWVIMQYYYWFVFWVIVLFEVQCVVVVDFQGVDVVGGDGGVQCMYVCSFRVMFCWGRRIFILGWMLVQGDVVVLFQVLYGLYFDKFCCFEQCLDCGVLVLIVFDQ